MTRITVLLFALVSVMILQAVALLVASRRSHKVMDKAVDLAAEATVLGNPQTREELVRRVEQMTPRPITYDRGEAVRQAMDVALDYGYNPPWEEFEPEEEDEDERIPPLFSYE